MEHTGSPRFEPRSVGVRSCVGEEGGRRRLKSLLAIYLVDIYSMYECSKSSYKLVAPVYGDLKTGNPHVSFIVHLRHNNFGTEVK